MPIRGACGARPPPSLAQGHLLVFDRLQDDNGGLYGVSSLAARSKEDGSFRHDPAKTI